MPYTNNFKKLLSATKSEYLGKKVPKKYQKRYGKVFDSKETKSVAFAIANKNKIKIH
jgi:hypothetical protein